MIWKRPHGVTIPLDSTDLVDFVVINSSDEQMSRSIYF